MELDDIYQAFPLGGDYPHYSDNSKKQSWFGPGCYFWNASLKTAVWWGDNVYKDQFQICHARFDADGGDFFDLVGKSKHREYWKEAKNKVAENLNKPEIKSRLKARGVSSKILAYHIILILAKEVFPDFYSTYKAIRGYAEECVPESDEDKTYFQDSRKSDYEPYMLDNPPVQLCVFYPDSDIFKPVDESSDNKFEIIEPSSDEIKSLLSVLRNRKDKK